METNILIKIQEDPSKNVISIVLTNQLWTDGRTDGRTHETVLVGKMYVVTTLMG
jgi:hypothetical protein